MGLKLSFVIIIVVSIFVNRSYKKLLMVTSYKSKSLNLKAIPQDIYQELIRVQAIEKGKRCTHFNLEQTIYKIIRTTIKKEKE